MERTTLGFNDDGMEITRPCVVITMAVKEAVHVALLPFQGYGRYDGFDNVLEIEG